MSKDWPKIDISGESVLWHVNLLNQKMTTDDRDDRQVTDLLLALSFVNVQTYN